MLTDAWLLRILIIGALLALLIPRPSESQNEIQEIIESGIFKFTDEAKKAHKATRANAHKIAQWIVDGAQKEKVDPFTILAMACKESSIGTNNLSPKGARGLAQFMPGGFYEIRVIKYLSHYYKRKITIKEIQSGQLAFHALAVGLRLSQEYCPDYPLDFYNSGKCKKSNFKKQVQRIAQRLFDGKRKNSN